VEERDGEEVEAVLGLKDSFDARALVHGAAGASFTAAEETLFYLAPEDILLDLLKLNFHFPAFFYLELSRHLTSYNMAQENQGGVEQVLRARVKDARLHEASFIDGSATLVDAGRMMHERNNNTLFVRDGDRVGIITGMNLSKAAVLSSLPLNTPVRDI